MSEQGLAAFVSALTADPGLAARVAHARSAEDIVAVAVERGFPVEGHDLVDPGRELTDADLEAVAGGTLGLGAGATVVPRCFPTWWNGAACSGGSFA